MTKLKKSSYQLYKLKAELPAIRAEKLLKRVFYGGLQHERI